MNTTGYFEIQSSIPSREVAFYQPIFGCKFIKEEYVSIDYYSIETESINGGLLKRPAKIPPLETGTNAFICSVQEADFDKTSEQIINADVQFALPKVAIPGRRWQGYFEYTNNNTFDLFQVDANTG